MDFDFNTLYRKINKGIKAIFGFNISDFNFLNYYMTDGFYSKSDYLTSPIRICFILKEAYGDSDWSFSDVLLDGKYNNCSKAFDTYTNMGMLAYCIKNNIKPYTNNLGVNQNHLANGLNSIYLINLSKICAGSQTKLDADYGRRVSRFTTQIQEQITESNADIYYFGSTWEVPYSTRKNEPNFDGSLDSIKWEKVFGKVESQKNFSKVFHGRQYSFSIMKAHGKILINAYHPECHADIFTWQANEILKNISNIVI